MPNYNGTGPLGRGPLTGYGSGKCVIPLNTKKKEMDFLNNQEKVLKEHLEKIENRIEVLKASDRKEKK